MQPYDSDDSDDDSDRDVPVATNVVVPRVRTLAPDSQLEGRNEPIQGLRTSGGVSAEFDDFFALDMDDPLIQDDGQQLTGNSSGVDKAKGNLDDKSKDRNSEDKLQEEEDESDDEIHVETDSSKSSVHEDRSGSKASIPSPYNSPMQSALRGINPSDDVIDKCESKNNQPAESPNQRSEAPSTGDASRNPESPSDDQVMLESDDDSHPATLSESMEVEEVTAPVELCFAEQSKPLVTESTPENSTVKSIRKPPARNISTDDKGSQMQVDSLEAKPEAELEETESDPLLSSSSTRGHVQSNSESLGNEQDDDDVAAAGKTVAAKNWEYYFQLAAAFLKGGPAYIPKSIKVGRNKDDTLGQWAEEQRCILHFGKKHFCENEDKKEKVDRLNEIGFLWYRPSPVSSIVLGARPNQKESGDSGCEKYTDKSWADACHHAEAYILRTGDHEIAVRAKHDGFFVGEWENEQRKLLKRVAKSGVGTEQEKRRVSMLNAIGFRWTSNKVHLEFDDWITVLRKYMEKEGSGWVPKNVVECDHNLGSWAAIQRKNLNKGVKDDSLNDSDKSNIDELTNRGFLWSPIGNSFTWEFFIGIYRNFVPRFGNIFILPHTTMGEFPIGKWAEMVRRIFCCGKKDLLLTSEGKMKVDALNKEGFVWTEDSPTAAVFEETSRDGLMTAETLSRRRETKDSMDIESTISSRSGSTSSADSKEMTKRSKLSFDSWFHLARAYMEREGTGYVPRTIISDNDNKLGSWCYKQRTNFKKQVKGDALPTDWKENSERLISHGFLQKQLDTTIPWDSWCILLRRYVEQHGRIFIPPDSIFQNYSIGEWAHMIRRIYRWGKKTELLTPEGKDKVDQLNAAGFVWEMSANVSGKDDPSGGIDRQLDDQLRNRSLDKLALDEIPCSAQANGTQVCLATRRVESTHVNNCQPDMNQDCPEEFEKPKLDFKTLYLEIDRSIAKAELRDLLVLTDSNIFKAESKDMMGALDRRISESEAREMGAPVVEPTLEPPITRWDEPKVDVVPRGKKKRISYNYEENSWEHLGRHPLTLPAAENNRGLQFDSVVQNVQTFRLRRLIGNRIFLTHEGFEQRFVRPFNERVNDRVMHRLTRFKDDATIWNLEVFGTPSVLSFFGSCLAKWEAACLDSYTSKIEERDTCHGSWNHLVELPSIIEEFRERASQQDSIQHSSAPTGARQNKASYEHFKKKYRETIALEFKGSGIRMSIATSSMWKVHKRLYPEGCSEECKCVFELPKLTADVVNDYLEKSSEAEKQNFNKDPSRMKGSYPVGFAGNFATKFLPRLSEQFPSESPQRILTRLEKMWGRHTHYIAEKCRRKCDCIEGWEDVFYMGDLSAFSQISTAPTNTRQSTLLTSDVADEVPIPRKRKSKPLQENTEVQQNSVPPVPKKQKNTPPSQQEVSNPGFNVAHDAKGSSPTVLQVAGNAGATARAFPKSAAIANDGGRDIRSAIPRKDTAYGQRSPESKGHATNQKESAGIREYIVDFDPGQPMGFYFRNLSQDESTQSTCTVVSVCPATAQDRDRRIQPGTSVVAVLRNDQREQISSWQQLKQFYEGADAKLKVVLINNNMAPTHNFDPIAALLERYNKDWCSDGKWRGDFRDGWAGGAGEKHSSAHPQRSNRQQQKHYPSGSNSQRQAVPEPDPGSTCRQDGSQSEFKWGKIDMSGKKLSNLTPIKKILRAPEANMIAAQKSVGFDDRNNKVWMFKPNFVSTEFLVKTDSADFLAHRPNPSQNIALNRSKTEEARKLHEVFASKDLVQIVEFFNRPRTERLTVEILEQIRETLPKEENNGAHKHNWIKLFINGAHIGQQAKAIYEWTNLEIKLDRVDGLDFDASFSKSTEFYVHIVHEKPDSPGMNRTIITERLVFDPEMGTYKSASSSKLVTYNPLVTSERNFQFLLTLDKNGKAVVGKGDVSLKSVFPTCRLCPNKEFQDFSVAVHRVEQPFRKAQIHFIVRHRPDRDQKTIEEKRREYKLQLTDRIDTLLKPWNNNTGKTLNASLNPDAVCLGGISLIESAVYLWSWTVIETLSKHGADATRVIPLAKSLRDRVSKQLESKTVTEDDKRVLQSRLDAFTKISKNLNKFISHQSDQDAAQKARLPALDSNWLETISSPIPPKSLCKFIERGQSCRYGHECNFVHVQPRWGTFFDQCYDRIPKEKTHLPVSTKDFVDNMHLKDRQRSDGNFWWTAGYRRVVGRNLPLQRIIYAEGSQAHRNSSGVCWFPTREEAKEALQRAITLSFWAEENRVRPELLLGPENSIEDHQRKRKDPLEWQAHSSSTRNTKARTASSSTDRDSPNSGHYCPRYVAGASRRRGSDNSFDTGSSLGDSSRESSRSRLSDSNSYNLDSPPSDQASCSPTGNHQSIHSRCPSSRIAYREDPSATTKIKEFKPEKLPRFWVEEFVPARRDCRFFHSHQGCRKGSSCDHAHIAEPLGHLLIAHPYIDDNYCLPPEAVHYRFGRDSKGSIWYTAAFRDPRTKIFYLAEEMGGYRFTDRGVWWYTSKEEATAALVSVVESWKRRYHHLDSNI